MKGRAQDGEIVLELEFAVPDDHYATDTFPTEHYRAALVDPAGETSFSLGLSGGATGGRVQITFPFQAERWAAAEFVRLELGTIKLAFPIAVLGDVTLPDR
ncbi:hypothetical protein GCM10028864_01120 [Microlunatus parietis]